VIIHKLRRLSLGAGYAGYAMIVVLSLLPAQTRPHSGIGGEYEHWLAYALVGGAFAASAAILELLQTFIPGRMPEFTGFLASSLGAWFGILIVALVIFLLCERKQ
jgi:hypothetical protein